MDTLIYLMCSEFFYKFVSQNLYKMKKLYIYLLCGFISGQAFAQIPNNDFENWTTMTAEKPTGWTFSMGNTKTTDKRSGNFAMKLQGDSIEEIPGVILQGMSDDGIYFYDGAPFAAQPDSLIFWAKYNIASGDSAMVYLQLKKAGVPLFADWFRFTGSSSTYKRFAYKINMAAPMAADSVILAFASTNIFADFNYSSWITIDDISFSGTTKNVPNPGFEDWKALTHFTPNRWSPNYDGEDLLDEDKPTVLRSFDAGTGGACVHIRNIDRGDWIESGETRTIKSPANQWFWGPTFPVSGKPDTLYGLYKWLPKAGDEARVEVTMWKAGSQIGSGTISTGVEQAAWAIAKVGISYWTMDSPDSAQILIYSSNGEAKGESDLFVDNLSFSPIFGAGTKNPFAVQFSVKPNPANETIHVQLPTTKNSSTARIYDATGRLVLSSEISAMNPAIQLSSLPAGTYSIRLDGLTGSRKFVKQ